MPTHKGIKLSVVSQCELKIHPEFPHPESSQFTYRSPNLARTGLSRQPSSSASEDSKGDRLLGRQSSVSVYIPSLSGARFWLTYNVEEAAVLHSQWFYFKLYMNGRLITSWGTHGNTPPSGQVMRGLFNPSERWNYKAHDTIYKSMGTEARPFYFAEEYEERSAADDGGLIEVQVFRARGRKRRLANPEDFRNQEQHGIRMPSEGLIDRPEDARFYDWHLKDPKNKPFAVFKFHYRSWNSLISLQLIPAGHKRALLPATPSLLEMNGKWRELQATLNEEGKEPQDNVKVEDGHSSSDNEEHEEPEEGIGDSTSDISSTPWLTTVFDDSPDRATKNRTIRTPFSVPPAPAYNECRTFEVPTSRFYDFVAANAVPTSRFSHFVHGDPKATISRLPHFVPGNEEPSFPNQIDCAGILNRPLPEIPQRSSSRKYLLHSENSSIVSHTLSVTPSLLPCLDRDTTSPEPIIGIAQVVPIPRSSPPESYSPTVYEDRYQGSMSSTGIYNEAPSSLAPPSPSPAAASRRRGMSSPQTIENFMSPNVTLRKHQRSSQRSLPQLLILGSPLSYKSPSKAPSKSPSKSSFKFSPSKSPSKTLRRSPNKIQTLKDCDEHTSALYNMSTITLSESEWMCRTPSPVRNNPEHAMVGRLLSPDVDRKLSPMRSLQPLQPERCEGQLRHKAMTWFEDVKGRHEHGNENDHYVNETFDEDIQVRTGNWI